MQKYGFILIYSPNNKIFTNMQQKNVLLDPLYYSGNSGKIR